MEKKKIKTNMDYCKQNIETMLEIYDVCKTPGVTKEALKKWLLADYEE